MAQTTAKEYRELVVSCLQTKYKLDENEAEKVVRESFLPEALKYYPEESIHVDIEHTADEIYCDYSHQ